MRVHCIQHMRTYVPAQAQWTLLIVYSETSDSGRSEIGIASLQRTQLEVPRYFLL